MMQINWKRLIVNLLPVRLRTGSIFGWLYALYNGIVDIYNRLLTYDTDVKYKLFHTSQVWAIEKVLNDAFDPVERRIYIADAGGNVIQPLYPDADLRPVLLDDDATGALVLQPDSGYTGGDFDFIVRLPYEYSTAQIYRVKALINFYKLVGKRYDIIYI